MVFRPVIDPVATIFERLLCGRRSESSDETRGYTLGGSALPSSDPIEASRRRYSFVCHYKSEGQLVDSS